MAEGTTTGYPRLFEPGHIGRLEVPNRILMAAMLVGYADRDGRFSERHIDYFEERARGGAGLLFTESVLADTQIQPVPEGAPVTTCESDVMIPRLTELVRRVHRHGAKIAFQVTPGEGRQSHMAVENVAPRAPSALPAVLNPNLICRELERSEIRRLVEACGEAALRAALAGFDLIDIHAHTGYLIDQFMSPLWNLRDDEYGGDFERRMRFPLEIIAAIRERLGRRFPVSFRLTAEHRIPGGRQLDEARRIAQRLEEAGIDLLVVDAGCYEAEHWMSPPIYLGEGCLLDLTAAIRGAVSIPVGASGSITRAAQAQELLEQEKADFVVLGRSLLADPQWPNKARQGREDETRPCILCNEYCLGRIPAACMVNPALGRESELAIQRTEQPRRVLVVGGGPGGMEAARVAAERGHAVTLLERAPILGGQLNPAGDADYKKCLHRLRDQMATQVERAGVRVELSSEGDEETLTRLNPEVVIVATGAGPRAGHVAGDDDALDVFALHGAGSGERLAVGRRVVIAGGGLNGCDAAVDLAQRGHQVTLVDSHDRVGRDLNHLSRGALMAKLDELDVTLRLGLRVTRLATDHIVARDAEGTLHELKADTVINALGVEPRQKLVEVLRTRVETLHVIGDCVEPRKVGEAIHEGYRAGLGV